MKNNLRNTFKFRFLFLGTVLFLWNCEHDQEITNQEIQQEKKRTEISFDQFKSNINSTEKLETFSRFFDINKLPSKTAFNQKNTNDFNNATILTDNIIRIEKNDFTTYTFTILVETENYEFYNLVLYVNSNQEIYKSHILKYTPSQKWLADTTQHFSGHVKIINDNFLNVDNLLQSRSSDDCIESVTTEWVCGAGNNHPPGHPSCRPDNNAVTEYIITIEYGNCSDNGGGNGDFDPETNGSGGDSTSGGGDGGVVTAPNTVPYTSQFKNFLSGTLNSVERTYYSSDSNIKNTIDRYLIQKNFSNIAKFDAKLALEFAENLNLNFQQFNWVFNNRNSEELNDIKNYLNEEIIPFNPEIQNFVKEAIDALMNSNENNFTANNYPGVNNGFPFDWWNNEDFVDQNIVLGFDEGFGNLTKAEKLLVALFPVQALIIRANKTPTVNETINRFGFNRRNEKSDAFRHAFFNAMNSNDAGDTIARLFSTAHESEVPTNLALEVQMDLFNNNIGHNIGNNASIFISDQDLSNAVYQALLNGSLRYLSPLSQPVIFPNYGITNSTQLIPTNQ